MDSVQSVEEIRKRERLGLETQVMLVVMGVSTTTLLCFEFGLCVALIICYLEEGTTVTVSSTAKCFK